MAITKIRRIDFSPTDFLEGVSTIQRGSGTGGKHFGIH